MGATHSNVHPETAKILNARINAIADHAKVLGIEKTFPELKAKFKNPDTKVACILDLQKSMAAASATHGSTEGGAGGAATADASLYSQLISRPWNKAGHASPVVVALPTSDEDIMTCISYAKANKLQISSCGGGHSAHSMLDGCFAIDMVKRQKCVYDKKANLIVCESGATLAAVGAELQRHGVNVPLGTNSTNGLCGMALCGGAGYFLGTLGLTADAVEYLDVVLSSGQLVQAKAGDDLYWASLGSGFCPGVILRIAFRCHAVASPLVMHTTITELAFSVSSKIQFITDWKKLVEEKLSLDCQPTMVLPCGAPVVPTVFISNAMLKDLSAADDSNNNNIRKKAKKLIESELSASTATSPDSKLLHEFASGAWVGRPSKFKCDNFFDDVQPANEDKQQSSHYVHAVFGIDRLSQEAIETFVHFTSTDTPTKSGVVIIMPLKTKANQTTSERSFEKNCFAYRNSKYLIISFGEWNEVSEGPEGKKKCTEWLSRFITSLSKLQNVLSFLAGDNNNNNNNNTNASKEHKLFDPLATLSATTASDTTRYVKQLFPSETNSRPSEKKCFSIGAPSRDIRNKVCAIVDKFDPDHLFRRHETFGYGGVTVV